MACRECHTAKVKCDREVPCSRCVRLKKECVKHESRQGQGRSNPGSKLQGVVGSTPHKKRSRTASMGSKMSTSRSNASLSDIEDEEAVAQMKSEDAAISAEVGSLHSDHFGLRHLIRMFVAIAMRRRNFGLLARAGRIAARNGITMDEVLCESSKQRGMDYLYPILLIPAPQQQVLGDNRVTWSELPKKLLKATNCVGASDEEGDDVVAHRWIWIRETDQGMARFLVTPAFERDICSWQQMCDTYKGNQKSIIEMFLPPSELASHPKAVAQQVSLFKNPRSRLQPSRIKTKIILKDPLLAAGKTSNEKIIDVEQILCYSFNDEAHLDLGYVYTEYILPQERSDSSTNQAQEVQGQDVVEAKLSENETAGHRPSFILDLDLDVFTGDDEFDAILDLIA